jgi:hypothetical protein
VLELLRAYSARNVLLSERRGGVALVAVLLERHSVDTAWQGDRPGVKTGRRVNHPRRSYDSGP